MFYMNIQLCPLSLNPFFLVQIDTHHSELERQYVYRHQSTRPKISIGNIRITVAIIEYESLIEQDYNRVIMQKENMYIILKLGKRFSRESLNTFSVFQV